MLNTINMKKEKPVRCYDLEGNFLMDFTSVDNASDYLGIDKLTIHKALSSQKRVLQYQLRYKNASSTINIGDVSNIMGTVHRVPVAKYFNGTLIKVYDSIREAAEKNDIDEIQLQNYLNDQNRNHIRKFVFKKIV